MTENNNRNCQGKRNCGKSSANHLHVISFMQMIQRNYSFGYLKKKKLIHECEYSYITYVKSNRCFSRYCYYHLLLLSGTVFIISSSSLGA